MEWGSGIAGGEQQECWDNSPTRAASIGRRSWRLITARCLKPISMTSVAGPTNVFRLNRRKTYSIISYRPEKWASIQPVAR
jgi:hypothetical protein